MQTMQADFYFQFFCVFKSFPLLFFSLPLTKKYEEWKKPHKKNKQQLKLFFLIVIVQLSNKLRFPKETTQNGEKNSKRGGAVCSQGFCA